MEIIGKVVEKLKIEEVFGMLFISALLIVFLPIDFLQYMQLYNFKIEYQMYISGIVFIIGSYYVICILRVIFYRIKAIFSNKKRVAIKYLKKDITIDEKSLLIETYYDSVNRVFRNSGLIDVLDGRKALLESKSIIYVAYNVPRRGRKHTYILQSFVVELLNKNIENGNIQVNPKWIRFKVE